MLTTTVKFVGFIMNSFMQDWGRQKVYGTEETDSINVPENPTPSDAPRKSSISGEGVTKQLEDGI